jgi:hypothetical protein
MKRKSFLKRLAALPILSAIWRYLPLSALGCLSKLPCDPGTAFGFRLESKTPSNRTRFKRGLSFAALARDTIGILIFTGRTLPKSYRSIREPMKTGFVGPATRKRSEFVGTVMNQLG